MGIGILSRDLPGASVCGTLPSTKRPISKNTLRRLLKFLHTLAAAGLTGATGSLAVVVILAPASIGTVGYVPIMVAMAKIAAWIIGPSMVLTVITGLLAMAAKAAFQDAGWVWAKAASGILVLEGGLHVLGPIQEEAKRGASALAGGPDPASVASLLTSEGDTLWLLLAVSIANIALGVWRPRLPNIPF
jgi:uncharacterized membrane protein